MAFRMPTSGRLRPWQFVDGRRTFEWTPDADVVMNDGEGLVAAAAAGIGLIQVPDYIAAGALSSGAVRRVLDTHAPPALPISVVYPSARGVTPRLRALLEALQGR